MSRGSAPGSRRWSSCWLVCSLAGYLWFLVQYRSPASGDTIKATYMMQVFVTLPLLAAEPLNWLQQAHRTCFLYHYSCALLLVWAHNLPAMITHFPLFTRYSIKKIERVSLQITLSIWMVI